MTAVFTTLAPSRFRPELQTGADRSLSAATLAGLLVTLMDRDASEPCMMTTRMDLEFSGLAVTSTLETEIEIVRPGRRVQTLDGVVICGGAIAARVTMQRIRVAETPDPIPRKAAPGPDLGTPFEPCDDASPVRLLSATPPAGAAWSAWARPGAPILTGRYTPPARRPCRRRARGSGRPRPRLASDVGRTASIPGARSIACAHGPRSAPGSRRRGDDPRRLR